MTLRERDSMSQVRVPVAEVPALVHALSEEETKWEEVMRRFPVQSYGSLSPPEQDSKVVSVDGFTRPKRFVE